MPTILLLDNFDFFPLKYLLKVLTLQLKMLNPLNLLLNVLKSEKIIEFLEYEKIGLDLGLRIQRIKSIMTFYFKIRID